MQLNRGRPSPGALASASLSAIILLTGALLGANPTPAGAAAGDTITQTVQKGANFLTPDVVNWTNSHGCIACHRQGAAVFALANAVGRGYSVNTSDANGLGYLASRIAASQGISNQGTNYRDGSWLHDNGWPLRNSKSSYAFFGLAGYDRYVSTRYSSNLVAAANWAMTSQYTGGGFWDGVWFEDHGAFATTYGHTPVTARIMVGIAQAKERVDSATAAAYQARLDRAAAWIGRNRDNRSGPIMAYNFETAYAIIGLKAAGRSNSDPDVAFLRNRLLTEKSTPTRRGWGYTVGHGADEFNTGIVLYALCESGVSLRDNDYVRDAANWLRDRQQNLSATTAYWNPGGVHFDIATTFAMLGLSCFGELGVEVSVVGADRQVVQANHPSTQTVTYEIQVDNHGAFEFVDTYNLSVQGVLPGWGASLSHSSVTLASGAHASVILTVTVPANLPQAFPAEMTVVATSRTDGRISDNVKVTTYTNPPPPVTGLRTTTVFTAGAGAVVTSRSTPVLLAARVTDVNGVVVRGPGRGVVIFSVAGIAVGTDLDSDGDGVFTLNWAPGAGWQALGIQDLRAVYSGIDFASEPDLLPSFAAGNITLNLPLNSPPVAAARSVTVNAEQGACSAAVAPSAVDNGSSDPDGDALTLSLSPAGPYAVGTTSVTLTVTDPHGESSTAVATITVVDAEAPLLTAPANVATVNDAGVCGASASSVSAGSATATDNCGVASVVGIRSDGKALSDAYPVGVTTITWTATDIHGNSSSGAQTVTVSDVEAPVVTSVSVDQPELWPPNHRMVEVTVSSAATDNCGTTGFKITGVTSNEPDNGLGDGDTAGDIEVTGDHTVRLRAERSGRGSGRIYTITITWLDIHGNSATGVVQVSVPHSKGRSK